MAPIPVAILVHLAKRQKPANPDDQNNEQNASVSGFVSSLVFNAAVALALLSAFMILRRKFPLIYAPRTFLVPEESRPERLQNGVFAWFSALKFKDQRLMDSTGEDAFSVLFYMRWLLRIFIFVAIVGAAILFPVHATSSVGMKGLDRLTLGNVAQSEQARLWANLILSWIFIGVILFVIVTLLRKAATLRHRYFFSEYSKNHLAGYTLLVRDVPPNMRSEDELRALFETVQPNAVRAVVLTKKLDNLQKLDKHRRQERLKLENYLTKYLLKITKGHADGAYDHGRQHREDRPTERTLLLGCSPHDAIDTHLGKLRHEQVELAAGRQNELPPDSAAFVVFSNLFAPHVAAGTNLYISPEGMADKVAGVDADDVIWDNLGLGYFQRQGRRMVALVLVVALVVFWGALTTFLSSIATLDNLVAILPFLDPITKWSPPATGIVQGVLPQVVIAVAFALIPVLLRLISKFGGVPTSAEIERLLINQYYAFLVFNVLFIVTIAGSIFRVLNTIINNPPEIVEMLATSIPTISSFFVNYVMLLALSGPASELLQVGNLILKPLMLRFLAKTPRQVLEKRRPPIFEIGRTLANHSFIATVGITYMTIAPLVSIFTAIYFGLWYLAYLYQMQFVYVWKASGGMYLHSAAKQLFVALYIHEVVMFAIFLLKTAWGQAVLMAIALAVTALCHRHAELYTNLMFTVPAKAALDESRATGGNPKLLGRFADRSGSLDKTFSTNTIRQDEEEGNGESTGPVDFSKPSGSTPQAWTPGDVASGQGSNDVTDDEYIRRALSHPALRDDKLTVWVPRDHHNVAESELKGEVEGGDAAVFSTQGASMDEQGRVEVANEVIAEWSGRQDVQI
ncbi:hypothetical protein HDV00_005746 [Rhizophlyctis rosea]|nr:hypothetical protein HDV00_005746 [Rhizophlyctis rosea]